jgi:hypothetical protein
VFRFNKPNIKFVQGASPLRGDRAIRSNKNAVCYQDVNKFTGVFVPLLSLARFRGEGFYGKIQSPAPYNFLTFF